MQQACSFLFEYSDFTSFSKKRTQNKNFNCKIIYAGWEKKDNTLIFTIRSDRFLRGMVRAIVGTLLEVGKLNFTLEKVREIIESKNRSLAGNAVPANGLFLTEVKYPDGFLKFE